VRCSAFLGTFFYILDYYIVIVAVAALVVIVNNKGGIWDSFCRVLHKFCYCDNSHLGLMLSRCVRLTFIKSSPLLQQSMEKNVCYSSEAVTHTFCVVDSNSNFSNNSSKNSTCKNYTLVCTMHLQAEYPFSFKSGNGILRTFLLMSIFKRQM
jgi:hypothetical protein